MKRKGRVSQDILHRRFAEALGSSVKTHSKFTKKPLELDLEPPLPSRIRVYIYNATDPPGGRTVGEHKIQLIVPGQERGQRGSFDYSDGRIVVLAGYKVDLGVFILWDADLYSLFAYSRNLQVKAETVFAALSQKVAMQERKIRGQGTEKVLAARSKHLTKALEERLRLTQQRLAGG